jgi:hypothetical protein
MCKGGKGEKSDGKKDKKFTFIRSREAIFKYDGKRGKRCEKARKGGKKDNQYAFIKSIQD